MVEHYGKKFSRRKALPKTNEERKSSNFGDQVPNLAIK
jgi:hypothetical protein